MMFVFRYTMIIYVADIDKLATLFVNTNTANSDE